MESDIEATSTSCAEDTPKRYNVLFTKNAPDSARLAMPSTLLTQLRVWSCTDLGECRILEDYQ